MRKHFLLWALLLSCTLPTLAHDFTVDGIFYNKLSDSTVAVTFQGDRYSSYSNEYAGNLIIPDSVLYRDVKYAITEIGSFACYGCTTLTSVIIPNTVITIGDATFRECSSLSSIVFSNNLLYIGESAFCECYALASIVLPNNLLSIGHQAFGKTALTSISLPNSITSMGYNVFVGCSDFQYNIHNNAQYVGNIDNPYLALIQVTDQTSATYAIHENTKIIAGGAFQSYSALTSITIPEGVVSIGESCFHSCSQLTSITLPTTLISIGQYAFLFCSALRAISIPDKVTIIPYGAFEDCSNLRPVTLPKNLTTIESRAFRDCSALPDITIPNTVTSIGNDAFRNCSGLLSITTEAITPPTCGSGVFSNLPSNAVVTVPCASVVDYKTATGWSGLTIESIFAYSFDAISANTEQGTVTINQVPTCENGCEAKMEATANEKYQFKAWNDGNTENPRTVIVTEDVTYTATFEPIKVESISLNHTETTLNKSETLQLEANVLPINALNKNVIWATENAAIATVSNGLVTAKEKGTVTIKAITTDGGKLATCVVTVVSSVTGITLDKTEVTLAAKSSTLLTATITPEDADNKNITWKSEDTNVAVVANGRVVALSVGQTTITATTEDGAYSASCLVKVEVPVSSITLNHDTLMLITGDAEQLLATVLPEDATNKNYTLRSDNESVAMVIDGGWIIAGEPGIAYITAISENGDKTAECRVRVGDIPDNITSDVVIDPSDESVDFSWSAIEDASSYIFVIYADEAQTEKICTLTFDAKGYLVRIDFLRQKPAASREAQRGFNFVVTGLNPGTTYAYTLHSYDAENVIISRQSGEFTTEGGVMTGVETLPYSFSSEVCKIFENGTIYILRNGAKYTIDGRKVE